MKHSRLLYLLPALAFSGCIEMSQDAVVNPDGSGKAIIEMNMNNPMAALGNLGQGDSGPAPDQIAQQMAGQMVNSSEGVDTWSDVEYGVTDEGKIHFKGTAYFKDFNSIRVGEEGSPTPTKFTLSELDNGNLKIAMETTESDEAEGESDSETPSDLSEEEIQQQIKEQRAQWNSTKSFMQPMLGGMKFSSTMSLPGEIVAVEGFTKKDDSTVVFEIDGQKMLETIDQLVMDDEFMTNAVKSGTEVGGFQSAESQAGMMEAVFGSKGFFVEFKPGEAQFDYSAEVEEAKANPSPALQKLIAD